VCLWQDGEQVLGLVVQEEEEELQQHKEGEGMTSC
jgi:hypothetical protein